MELITRRRRYAVYIMASLSGTLYTGMTGNLVLRVRAHKNKTLGGFTAKYGCDRLVYFERFAMVEFAIRREKELKGWKRAKKIALIESMNPSWADLAGDWFRVPEPLKEKRG
jgi:putative endonuclease